ncbi:hypothetical protein PHISCL_04061 [Aspergillus sclerotialis]|uniref:Aminotransferase class I/classII large domain-containing protein n=1 Tax=Aspergillus sclerotialis TaxID=2070753 RepID=A0A3A3A0D5_9EURO|nr:hypothetical protein PHISCL_04061 [Aspergillus sclerotialis]
MASTISTRGEAFAEKKPVFFRVLDNLWNPESNPEGIVNIGLAENALLHRELVEFMNSEHRTVPHALTYGDSFSGSKTLRQALSRFLNRKFSPQKPLLPSNLLVTSGTSNAIECCAWSLFNAGDYVLVGRPYWTAFKHLFGTRARVNILEVSFGQVDPLSLQGIELYEEAYKTAVDEGKRVRAILLCSPNNPLGSSHSDARPDGQSLKQE